jgi:hypothetical protein
MRRSCLGIAGILAAATLAGCSDTGVQEGPVPFKGTSTDQFNGMTNQMKKNATSQVDAKKAEGDAKPADTKPAAESKPADTKPAAESKPADTKPAGDTNPADTKPAGGAKPPG